MAAWKPGIEILLWFCNYGTNHSALSAKFGWANIWLCIFTQVSQWLLCLWKKKSSDILSLARTHICLCIINDGAMRLIGSNIILSLLIIFCGGQRLDWHFCRNIDIFFTFLGAEWFLKDVDISSRKIHHEWERCVLYSMQFDHQSIFSWETEHFSLNNAC